MDDVRRLLDAVGIVAIGHILRRAGVISVADGALALVFARRVTLPAALLTALLGGPALGPVATASVLVTSAIFSAAFALVAAQSAESRAPREHAALASAGAGCEIGLIGLPLLGAIWGPAGAKVAALWFLPSAIAEATAGAGAATAAAECTQLRHADGGVYAGDTTGSLTGPKKDGAGVYRYPGGAVYAGSFRGDVKCGHGVYTYPNGGYYAGEWAGGTRCGVGARGWPSGRVRTGRWRGAACVEDLPPSDVATAVATAHGAAAHGRQASRAAAEAARGGAGALISLALSPPTIALSIAASLAVAAAVIPGSPPAGSLYASLLPSPAAAAVAVVAAAHGPLALLAVGATLEPGAAAAAIAAARLPPSALVPAAMAARTGASGAPLKRLAIDAAACLVLKYVTGVLTAAALLLILAETSAMDALFVALAQPSALTDIPSTLGEALGVGGAAAAAALRAVSPLLALPLMPVPLAAAARAARFRLDGTLTRAMLPLSQGVSFVALVLLLLPGVLLLGGGAIPPLPTWPTFAAPIAMAVVGCVAVVVVGSYVMKQGSPPPDTPSSSDSSPPNPPPPPPASPQGTGPPGGGGRVPVGDGRGGGAPSNMGAAAVASHAPRAGLMMGRAALLRQQWGGSHDSRLRAAGPTVWLRPPAVRFAFAL